jgi:hypothetical protein
MPAKAGIQYPPRSIETKDGLSRFQWLLDRPLSRAMTLKEHHTGAFERTSL